MDIASPMVAPFSGFFLSYAKRTDMWVANRRNVMPMPAGESLNMQTHSSIGLAAQLRVQIKDDSCYVR